LNEPSGNPIQQLLQVPQWQFAGAMALIRNQGVSLPDAQRMAGLPAGTLGLVSDDRGRPHPQDMQADLVQAAGADAPRLRALLTYLHQEQQHSPQAATSHATPAATPGLDPFAAELEAQLVQTPGPAQPQPDP
jgi:hypothetical protein